MNSGDIKKRIAAEMLARRRAEQEQASFEQFTASQLYCPKCKRAMPVREKHLLVLSDGDLIDFVCTSCGTSLGTRRG